MFRAMSLCAFGSEEGCLKLRASEVKYMSDYVAEFKEIFLRDLDEDLSFDIYLDKIAPLC